MTTYTVAGGCFWCLDGVYARVKGVSSIISGYTGGDLASPTYEVVCTGQSGHAEAIELTFDEAVVPSEVILDIFFTIHNPTTLNRQGNDVGTQYRSAMYYDGERQRRQFMAAIERAEALWSDPIVTELSELGVFYAAEDNHQGYYDDNPSNPYCSIVIAPKIVKARAGFSPWLHA